MAIGPNYNIILPPLAGGNTSPSLPSYVATGGTAAAPAFATGPSANYGWYYDSATSSLSSSVNGVQNLYLSATQAVLPATNSYMWAGRTQLTSPADGQIIIASNNGTSANGQSLIFGTNTAPGSVRLDTASFGGVGEIIVRRGDSAAVGYFLANFLNITVGAPGYANGNASTYGYGFADTTHTTIYTAGTAALNIDSTQNAVFSKTVTVGSASADPSGSNGMMYYNTTSNTLKVFVNGAWKTFTVS